MHVRAPSATLCAPNNPYSYSNHGLSPWKKTSIVDAKMDYVSFVEISSTRSSLVQFQTGFVSKKIQQKFTVYYIPSDRILSFVESKVSARFIRNLFRLFWNSFSTLFFLFTFRSVQLYITQNGVKVRRKTFAQKSGKFVRYRSTINSIPPRSKSLISFDF